MEKNSKQKHGNYLYFYYDPTKSQGLLPHISFKLTKGITRGGISSYHRLDGPALIVLYEHEPKISKYRYEYGNRIQIHQ